MKREDPLLIMTQHLLQYTKEWGAEEDSLTLKNSHSKFFKKGTISGKVDDVRFLVIVYAKAEQGNNQMNTSPVYRYNMEPELVYRWDLSVIFLIDNKHDLELKISKETLGHKIKKLFGNNDLEVYEDRFDKTFKIECSNNYAHIDILTSEIQQKLMLQAKKDFSQFWLQGDQLRYKSPYSMTQLRTQKKTFQRLLTIGLLLAQKAQNWQPPVKD